MGMVKVFSWATGRIVLMDETLANGYFRLNGAYVVGSPVNDAAALRRPFWAPAAPVVINWKSMPKIASGGGDYVLAPDNYLNDDPTVPLLNVTGLNRRVVIAGQPGQPMRLRSRGDLISGYGLRLLLQNTWLEAANPGVYGQAAGRLLRCDDAIRAEVYNCLIDGTSGCSLGTGGSKKWQGSAANGDIIALERNDVRNIRGQCSDGAYDPANPLEISAVHSNWGSTHSDDQRWNPAVAAGDRTAANKSDPGKFGPLGWISSQFVQFRQQGGLYGRVCNNRIVNVFGKSRPEDNINVYGGMGGTAAQPLLVQGNYIEGGQGYDWNYVPGSGVAYDGSNQVTLNASGYQNTDLTRYSGSAHITDAWDESTDNGCWDRQGYVDFFDTVVLGNLATIQTGHNIRMRRVKVYQTLTTQAGDPLAYQHFGFQVTRYDDDDGSAAQARDTGGTLRDIWGSNEVSACELHAGNGSGASLLSSGDLTDLRMNGGLYDASTNIQSPQLAVGFEAQVRADWSAAMANAGLTIGLTG